MKKVMIGLLLGIFLVSFVFAANGNGIQAQDTTGPMHDEIIAAGGLNGSGNLEMLEIQNRVRENVRAQLMEGEGFNLTGNNLAIRKINQEMVELKSHGNGAVRTRLNLSIGDANELKAKLSNGRNAEIKVMPEVASETALARLRLKNCNETRNCSIELKEVGVGNQTRLAYEAKAEKTFRLFGLFRNKESVMTQVDAENGEVIATNRPWWAWMASEEDEADE